MRQYVIVHFIQPFPEPMFPRAAWPLHLTILGPFTSNEEFPILADHMKMTTPLYKPMVITGCERKMFGRKNDVRATVIKRTSELLALHTALLNSLKSSIQLKVPTHSGTGYSPHISDRPHAKYHQGQTTILDSLSLIEYAGENGVIVATIHLY